MGIVGLTSQFRLEVPEVVTVSRGAYVPNIRISTWWPNQGEGYITSAIAVICIWTSLSVGVKDIVTPW